MKATCPHCGAVEAYADELAGISIPCRSCDGAFDAPSREAVEAEAAADLERRRAQVEQAEQDRRQADREARQAEAASPATRSDLQEVRKQLVTLNDSVGTIRWLAIVWGVLVLIGLFAGPCDAGSF